MRKYLVALVALVAIGGIIWFVNGATEPAVSEYSRAVAAYQEISIDDLEEKLTQQEEFILYIGRETCPYCREFVPKLTEVVEETNATVLYLDSEEDPTGKIGLFRQASGLKTVPSLTYFKQGQLSGLLRKGSQASQEEIKQFLQLAMD